MKALVVFVTLAAVATIVGVSASVLFKSYSRQVSVTLNEWSITPSVKTISSGEVDFIVTNAGTRPHEFVIFKTNLAPDALPVENNEVQEDKLDHISELDVFPAGETEQLSVNLAPGRYIFICNIVETPPGQPVISHFEKGMWSEFTVTQ